MTPTRPTRGRIIRVNGEIIDVRYVPDPERDDSYIPLRMDGKNIELYPGDRISVDVLGPGQSISIATDPGSPGTVFEGCLSMTPGPCELCGTEIPDAAVVLCRECWTYATEEPDLGRHAQAARLIGDVGLDAAVALSHEAITRGVDTVPVKDELL